MQAGLPTPIDLRRIGAILTKQSPPKGVAMPRAFPFDNSYARLGRQFYQLVNPTPVASPQIIIVNESLAAQLGLDPEHLTAPVLCGNQVPAGAQPLAMAYAGHQFGHFVPQLGDGRAILLGEVVDADGNRRDLQLKGSGLTPFSRRGDGRAALGPVLREYLVSEAMAVYGIPTTRALAALATGEAVLRERPLPGAVLARVAASHLRIGTFQYFAARGDGAAVRQLADYTMDRHFPSARQAPLPYLALLEQIIQRQSRLIAQWLLIGFIHGVMNTDNMAVSGETIDFGPCAFLDVFDPQAVFSSIDRHGRYAYGNQPAIALWNLTRLAEVLLPLLAPDEAAAMAHATAALDGFYPAFDAAYLEGLRRKLGLEQPQEGDLALAQDLLRLMAEQRADFTVTFRNLGNLSGAFGDWQQRWTQRLAQEGATPASRQDRMHQANPAIIPRNHRIEQVIQAAIEEGDYTPFFLLHHALQDPFGGGAQNLAYEQPPQPQERVLATFCGT